MARIVISTWGSYGDVLPYLGLALELRRRGHVPVFALPGIYRELVGREGFEFRAVRPDLDIKNRTLAARIMDPVKGSEVLFAEVLMPGLRNAYDDLTVAAEGADLLITHPASPAAPIVAEKTGRPWVSTVLAPISFFSVTDPFVPPPAPWLHPLFVRSRTLSHAFRWLSHRLTANWVRPVAELRQSLGLPPDGNPILDGQHSPHCALALFSSVLAQRQPDWPAASRVVGPVLYNGPGEPALPAHVRGFLDAGPPPVVFTLGTSAVEAAGSFYRIAADAIRQMDARAILMIGRHAENRPAADDGQLLSVDYVPHAALFPHAAVIVHQGGAGTLHQALASGRPTLVVPHAHDQPDNARRVQRLGVSRTLYPKVLSPHTLRRELEALAREPSYAARARAVAATVRSEAGALGAADAIEAVLHDWSRRR
jgi:rhamnosyltransferase subunit B